MRELYRSNFSIAYLGLLFWDYFFGIAFLGSLFFILITDDIVKINNNLSMLCYIVVV